MWLLSSDRAELHFFSAPDAATGGYAILSHTWTDNEQTFQDLVALQERCKVSGENPRDLVLEKIRQCCLIAREHGYAWVWIDTCCIDKTSSVELSEAINSMFRWYSCAEICYAHLDDVPRDGPLDAADSAFRRARWHTRGWTLQELLAPAMVLFLSSDWTVLGDKHTLAELLGNITGIPRQVLTREWHFSVMSVAHRLSWASARRTTRIEDEAYCLMGLFNVHMPTLYGEGRQAFQRLQFEIMKQSFDTSIFAWGCWSTITLEPITIPQIYRSFNTTSKNHVYLLATSPESFAKPFNNKVLRFSPNATAPLQPYLPWQWKNASPDEPEDSERRTKGPFGRLELPKFQATSYGIECRLPIFESQGITGAVLLCDTIYQHVGLLLHPSNANMQDPSRPIYHAGYGFKKADGTLIYVRLVTLGKDWYNLQFNGQPITAEWRDIYIADGPPPLQKADRQSLVLPLSILRPAPPFQIPHWLIGRLNTLGMEVRAPVIPSRPTAEGAPLRASLTFEDVNAKEAVRILMGTCAGQDEEGKDRPVDIAHPTHWARAEPLYDVNWTSDIITTHVCAEDHVEDWKGMTKDFTLEGRTLRLTFRRSKLTPDVTLVVHLELVGEVYERLKTAVGLTFPPLPSESKEAEHEAGDLEPPRKRTLTLEVPMDETKSSQSLEVHITAEALPVANSPMEERPSTPSLAASSCTTLAESSIPPVAAPSFSLSPAMESPSSPPTSSLVSPLSAQT